MCKKCKEVTEEFLMENHESFFVDLIPKHWNFIYKKKIDKEVSIRKFVFIYQSFKFD